MTEADFPGSEIVDALDARVDDSFSLPPHTELDQQFAEIIEAQKLIDEMESQLSDSTNLEPARKPGAAFITQGFVSGIEIGSPERCSVKTRSKSLTVIFSASFG